MFKFSNRRDSTLMCQSLYSRLQKESAVFGHLRAFEPLREILIFGGTPMALAGRGDQFMRSRHSAVTIRLLLRS